MTMNMQAAASKFCLLVLLLMISAAAPGMQSRLLDDIFAPDDEISNEEHLMQDYNDAMGMHNKNREDLDLEYESESRHADSEPMEIRTECPCPKVYVVKDQLETLQSISVKCNAPFMLLDNPHIQLDSDDALPGLVLEIYCA